MNASFVKCPITETDYLFIGLFMSLFQVLLAHMKAQPPAPRPAPFGLGDVVVLFPDHPGLCGGGVFI